MPEEYDEDVPMYAIPCVDGPNGSVIAYIDVNLGIREAVIAKGSRWHPGFMVPTRGVGPTVISHLKTCLRQELPGADEVRLLRSPTGFFLYAIRFAKNG